MLVVRSERVLTASEAAGIREGDHVYFLAPPEKAQALDRFFVDMPPPAAPDPRLLGDFFVGGDVTLGALAEIYGIAVAPQDAAKTLADHLTDALGHPARPNDVLALGAITLVVQKVVNGRATSVGLQLAEPDPVVDAPKTTLGKLKRRARATFGIRR
jgi:cell volume regulation protein A